MKSIAKLEYGSYYHIYNRGVNRENIFKEGRNYQYFLKQYSVHIEPIADTFAYCLLKNHFHLLIRIKTMAELLSSKDLTGFENLSGLKLENFPSLRFSNFFNAYSKTINNTYSRTGPLFERPFRRIEIFTDAYFTNLIHYIHFNPQKHGCIDDFRVYPYSSYGSIISERFSRLKRDAVLAWFHGKEGYINFHNSPAEEAEIREYLFDDEF